MTRAKGDHVEYPYADPLVCNCLYPGNQQVFDNYKHELFERRSGRAAADRADVYRATGLVGRLALGTLVRAGLVISS